VQNAPSGTLEKLKKIYSKSTKNEDEVKFVIAAFNELGSVEYAQKEADRLVAEASGKFEAMTNGIPESQAKAIARDGIGVSARRKV